MIIKSLSSKKIHDSRKEPTIEVSVNGQKASAPSGKSTGKYETPPYRKSLAQSIKDLNSLDLSGLDINSFSDLSKIESIIKKKFHLPTAKKFGANALVVLEIAILKALAKNNRIPLWKTINPNSRKLPTPLGNAIGGGLHSHSKNHPAFQEFIIIPSSKKNNIKLMTQIHKKLKSLLKSKSKNDEGAWNTTLNNEQVLSLLSKFKQIKLGIDLAANSFYKSGSYKYKNKSLSRDLQIKYINSLIKKYNLFYIEDPMQEQDFQGFSKIFRSSKNLVVGDDLTATQIPRIKKAISKKSINALIIKPNQNGSLIDLKEIFQLCKKHKIKTILSHRSGETLDDALADLAFGFQADFIKTGIATKYRQVKLKRLMKIEKSL